MATDTFPVGAVGLTFESQLQSFIPPLTKDQILHVLSSLAASTPT